MLTSKGKGARDTSFSIQSTLIGRRQKCQKNFKIWGSGDEGEGVKHGGRNYMRSSYMGGKVKWYTVDDDNDGDYDDDACGTLVYNARRRWDGISS